MSRLSSALLAAAAAVPLSVVASPSGPAVAEDVTSRVVLSDPTGDVWTIAEGEDQEWTSAGDTPTADVIGAVVRHGGANVVVKMTFTNLRRVEPQVYGAMITSRGDYGAVFLWTGPEKWGGRHLLVDEQFGEVKCAGLRHGVDYDAELVVMTIPRSCLDRPDWVKVGLSNTIFRGETDDEFQEVTDNPHTADHDGSMTARLYRATS